MSDTGVRAGVESVLARCLLDADFLRQVASDPDRALAPYDLDEKARADFAALDFRGVQNFAGFVTKIQHNDLWESLPFTRALLKYYGIEIEAFAAYHGVHLRLRARHASRIEKVASFLAFLDDYVAARDDPRLVGLRGVLTHERMEWEVRNAAVDDCVPDAEVGVEATPFGSLVPAARGAIRIASFRFSPLAIATHLASGTFDPADLVAHPHCLAYLVDSGSRRLRVLEVDDVTAALLAEVDGRRSVRTVVRRATGHPNISLSAFRPIFEAAVECGLLSLRPRGGSA